MPDPVNRFPTSSNLAWVERAIGNGARVMRGRRLTGGVTSSVHSLTVQDRTGNRHHVVLRRWVGGEDGGSGSDHVAREVRILTGLEATDLPAPRLLAADQEGIETGGVPALLMTRLSGHLHLSPSDPERWLSQMAAMLSRIHNAEVDAPGYFSWLDVERLEVPGWSKHPQAWSDAIEISRSNASTFDPRFIHRDYQHFNLLWSRERLTGIVDWIYSCTGPPDIDVGHCRLNLAVLFSTDWAERFRAMYENEAGRRVDPWWDVNALLEYLPGWGKFIEAQVAGRATVDRAGRHGRVDDLLIAALRDSSASLRINDHPA